MDTFGQRLKLLRKEKGLTGQQLGDMLNVAKITISRWENNKRFPDKDTLLKLTNIFNVTTDFILGKSDVRNYSKENHQINEYHVELNPKDKKDIEKMTNKFLEGIDGGVMLNGEVLDDEDMELFKQAIRNGIEYAKVMNKQKYTPKKYRK